MWDFLFHLISFWEEGHSEKFLFSLHLFAVHCITCLNQESFK